MKSLTKVISSVVMLVFFLFYSTFMIGKLVELRGGHGTIVPLGVVFGIMMIAIWGILLGVDLAIHAFKIDLDEEKKKLDAEG